MSNLTMRVMRKRISKHYKNHFDLNSLNGRSEHIIDWAEELINDLIKDYLHSLQYIPGGCKYLRGISRTPQPNIFVPVSKVEGGLSK